MLFHISLFALQQTKHRQNAWLQSFLLLLWWLWLLLMTEMMMMMRFVSAIVVFVGQFFVGPSPYIIIIMQDIAKLKRETADLLHDLRGGSPSPQPLPAAVATPWWTRS